MTAKLRFVRLYSKWFVADNRFKFVVKQLCSILLLGLLAAGCASTSIAKRKDERPSAYAGLTLEQRALVDQGRIQVGLPMDAVYIAWGRPTQIMNSQMPDGKALTTWIYHGTSWQEYRYWSYSHNASGYAHTPNLQYDYIPQSYVAAQVVFENGVVKTWQHQTEPRPY